MLGESCIQIKNKEDIPRTTNVEKRKYEITVSEC